MVHYEKLEKLTALYTQNFIPIKLINISSRIQRKVILFDQYYYLIAVIKFEIVQTSRAQGGYNIGTFEQVDFH